MFQYDDWWIFTMLGFIAIAIFATGIWLGDKLAGYYLQIRILKRKNKK